LRLISEVDLNEAQSIDGSGDEPRYIRGLVGQGSPLGESVYVSVGGEFGKYYKDGVRVWPVIFAVFI